MVSLEFVNTPAVPFDPTVVCDQDGRQTGRNGNFVVPGGWQDSCLLGVTGDWMIRAVVDRLLFLHRRCSVEPIVD